MGKPEGTHSLLNFGGSPVIVVVGTGLKYFLSAKDAWQDFMSTPPGASCSRDDPWCCVALRVQGYTFVVDESKTGELWRRIVMLGAVPMGDRV